VLQRHGWTLIAHPLLLDQIDKLALSAERAKKADPAGWRNNANVKLLRTIGEVMRERVPRAPLSPEFRQGNTLGPSHRHWFRAKFGANRFRLFFRADSASRIIVYAWVNDRDTLRNAGASSDPYAVFAGMLNSGNPPGEWSGLLAEARAAEGRFVGLMSDPDLPHQR
jgi:toxin YhaV